MQLRKLIDEIFLHGSDRLIHAGNSSRNVSIFFDSFIHSFGECLSEQCQTLRFVDAPLFQQQRHGWNQRN